MPWDRALRHGTSAMPEQAHDRESSRTSAPRPGSSALASVRGRFIDRALFVRGPQQHVHGARRAAAWRPARHCRANPPPRRSGGIQIGRASGTSPSWTARRCPFELPKACCLERQGVWTAACPRRTRTGRGRNRGCPPNRFRPCRRTGRTPTWGSSLWGASVCLRRAAAPDFPRGPGMLHSSRESEIIH